MKRKINKSTKTYWLSNALVQTSLPCNHSTKIYLTQSALINLAPANPVANSQLAYETLMLKWALQLSTATWINIPAYSAPAPSAVSMHVQESKLNTTILQVLNAPNRPRIF